MLPEGPFDSGPSPPLALVQLGHELRYPWIRDPLWSRSDPRLETFTTDSRLELTLSNSRLSDQLSEQARLDTLYSWPSSAHLTLRPDPWSAARAALSSVWTSPLTTRIADKSDVVVPVPIRMSNLWSEASHPGVGIGVSSTALCQTSPILTSCGHPDLSTAWLQSAQYLPRSVYPYSVPSPLECNSAWGKQLTTKLKKQERHRDRLELSSVLATDQNNADRLTNVKKSASTQTQFSSFQCENLPPPPCFSSHQSSPPSHDSLLEARHPLPPPPPYPPPPHHIQPSHPSSPPPTTSAPPYPTSHKGSPPYLAHTPPYHPPSSSTHPSSPSSSSTSAAYPTTPSRSPPAPHSSAAPPYHSTHATSAPPYSSSTMLSPPPPPPPPHPYRHSPNSVLSAPPYPSRSPPHYCELQSSPLNLSVSRPTPTSSTQRSPVSSSNGGQLSQPISQKTSQSANENAAQVSDEAIEEHFRRSLGQNYSADTSGSQSQHKSTAHITLFMSQKQCSVDEHFARALGDQKWQELKAQTEPVDLLAGTVDAHFAKALGANTWRKLRADQLGAAAKSQAHQQEEAQKQQEDQCHSPSQNGVTTTTNSSPLQAQIAT